MQPKPLFLVKYKKIDKHIERWIVHFFRPCAPIARSASIKIIHFRFMFILCAPNTNFFLLLLSHDNKIGRFFSGQIQPFSIILSYYLMIGSVEFCLSQGNCNRFFSIIFDNVFQESVNCHRIINNWVLENIS